MTAATTANVQILHDDARNTPSKPEDMGPSTGRTQALRRYTATVYDPHRHPTARGGKFALGRPWWGEKEQAANRDVKINGRPPADGFVGPITPGAHLVTDSGAVDRAASFASVWDAPWLPTAKYHRFIPQQDQMFLRFEYGRMRMDEVAGRQRYWQVAAKLGAQLGVPVDPAKSLPTQIALLLNEPSEMYRIADAALAGDPWLLSFIDEPNPDLARILSIHPVAGIIMGAGVTSYAPSATEPPPMAKQPEIIEAVLAAPETTDLVELIARTVGAMFDARDRQAAEKKAADKARMDRIRPKSKHKTKAKAVERRDNVQVTD